MRILTARQLDSGLFQPFGSLIAPGRLAGVSVNEGRGRRMDMATVLQHAPEAQNPALAWYEIEPSSWPVPLSVMERHRHSEQMFLFLAGAECLVVVAQEDSGGNPDLATAEAFTGAPGQGIIYARGVWHLPMVALRQPGRFAMMMWETATVADCDTCLIEQACQVQPAIA